MTDSAQIRQPKVASSLSMMPEAKSFEGEVIVVIPARGGSMGLPCKNIRPLGGKPLVAWSIEQALAVRGVSRVIVSTDDEDIAEVAIQYGAQVPFLRPRVLAGSEALIGSAVSYTVRRLVNEHCVSIKALITLYPTSPFRRAELLQESVDVLSSGRARRFQTVKPIWTYAGKFVVPEQGAIRPLQSENGDLHQTCYRSYGLVSGSRVFPGARGAQREAQLLQGS